MRRLLVLTCEHGGNRIPAPYRVLFASRRARAAVDSHRGYDLGALALARRLSRILQTDLIYSTVTRLLVETNKTVGHKALFSEFSARLPEAQRGQVLERYYHPHRRRVTEIVDRLRKSDCQVVHVAVHSFTPRLRGETRRADIALLYDPERPAERQFCDQWLEIIRQQEPSLRYRKNYPYRGRDDGFTTWLRHRHGDPGYLGIELEINQRLLVGPDAIPSRVARATGNGLGTMLQQSPQR